MKVQFLLVVVLCVAVKGEDYVGRVPVIKDGVPVDTPEVQAAKAAHFEAFERARIQAAKNPSNGQYEERVVAKYRQPTFQQVQQYQAQQYQPQAHGGYHQQQYEDNVFYQQPGQQHFAFRAYSSDLPTRTPEVQQAPAVHLAALSQAQNHHFRFRRGIFLHSAAPEDTQEVQAAKYQHLVAHATVHFEDVDDYYHAPTEDFYHVPVITSKGVPVNTAAVKAVRQQHQIAHELEKTGLRYSGGFSVVEPVISPNGVPFETPEVYRARVQHLAAHVAESNKHNHQGYGEGYEL